MSQTGSLLSRSSCFIGSHQMDCKELCCAEASTVLCAAGGRRHGFQLEVDRNGFCLDSVSHAFWRGIDLLQAVRALCHHSHEPWFGTSVNWKLLFWFGPDSSGLLHLLTVLWSLFPGYLASCPCACFPCVQSGVLWAVIQIKGKWDGISFECPGVFFYGSEAR